MTDEHGEEIDQLMSEIGMRLANETLGKPLKDDDVDDILTERLSKASKEQLFEVADIMIDVLAVSDIMRHALSDGSSLDEEEVEQLTEFLYELEGDTKEVMIDLVK